jgi:hypothetical protein
MVKVIEIKRTCLACPAQWEGQGEAGCVYIRFRWGHLTVGVGPTIKDAVAAEPIFEWHDPELGSFMDYDKLKKITKGVLDLPNAESVEDESSEPSRKK